MKSNKKVRRDVPQRSRLGRWFVANRETNADADSGQPASAALLSSTAQLIQQATGVVWRKGVVRVRDEWGESSDVFVLADNGEKIPVSFAHGKHTHVHKNKSVREADIGGVKLAQSGEQSVRWESSDFTGSNLSGTQVRGSVEKCIFDDAQFGLADFSNSSAKQCSWRRANLNTFRGERTKMEQGDFFGASLRDADLLDAELRESVFDEADLSGSNLAGADLRNCS